MKENQNITKQVVDLNTVEEKVLSIRDTQVIIDSDVAALYGVENSHQTHPKPSPKKACICSPPLKKRRNHCRLVG